ncbi:MAG: hypothetical protein J6A77_09710 [Lachnospiraceae bacterium]|nr:hypothetical protein [Lachnospiraceae bacterium]
MKKFMKFLCGAASMAAVAFGAYCIYKNVIEKKDDDDFDDFDDCFDEEAEDDADENREYVSINITEETPAENEEPSVDSADSNGLTEEEYSAFQDVFTNPEEKE